MKTSVAKLERRGGALVTADDAAAIRNALQTSIYPGASDASVDMVLAYCRASNLDPMTKPVHIVPMKVSTGQKDANGWDVKATRDVVMPGIGLYRINASRTGQYAGCSEPEFGPTRQLNFSREVWSGPKGNRKVDHVPASIDYPEWCRITVRKLLGSVVVEFTAIEYWLENYASKGDDGAPNAMWEKRAFGQLAKCTEAQALRKAFPEAVGSQPTAEEMEGKVIDVDATVIHSDRPAMPQARIEATAAAEPAANATDANVEPEPAPAAAAGVHDLSPGQVKLLQAKAKGAGFLTESSQFDEAALLAKFPSIGPANINDVLAQLRVIAEQRDAQ